MPAHRARRRRARDRARAARLGLGTHRDRGVRVAASRLHCHKMKRVAGVTMGLSSLFQESAIFRWYSCLMVVCVVAPYLLGVRPRRPEDWWAVGITIAFLTWLLVGLAFLRST
jgi:hypothetical protein